MPATYPSPTPMTAGSRKRKFHVSSTVMIMPVSGARTTAVKNAAMQMTMSASEAAGSIPICMQRRLMSAPSPAPIASMGTNAPQGTPAPMLETVTSSRSKTTSSSVTHSGEEKTACTPAKPLPRSDKKACPPPIA